MDASSSNALACLRCETPMKFLGTERFRVGTNWGILGDIGEWFEGQAPYDVYACSQCGKVELFMQGVGENHRPK